MYIRLLSVALVCLISVVLHSLDLVSAQVKNDEPIIIVPKTDIDERLFLIRALERTYTQWPKADEDPAMILAWIKGTRLRMTRLQKSIEVDNLDRHIENLYKECLTLLEDYEKFLLTVGAIQRDQLSDSKDIGSIGYDAAARGFGIIRSVQGVGVSAPYVLAAGGIVALGSGLYDLYQKNNGDKELTEARKQSLNEQATWINNQFEKTFTAADTAVSKLSEKFKWGQEAGFDESSKAALETQRKSRPRDPFVLVSVAQNNADSTDPDALMQHARLSLEAAMLVPSGKVYDPFRAEFIAVAANLATAAAGNQLQSRDKGAPAYSNGPASHAIEAIRLLKTYLQLEPQDPKKLGYNELARALAMAGRFGEAIVAANTAKDRWKDDRSFCYRYARLMSLTQQVDAAGEWLERAYSLGWDADDPQVVKNVRDDPDLTHFRKNKPAEYERLTTVNTTVRIVFGFFNDDIILDNKSPFTLTNVHITGYINQGTKEWPLDLKVTRIAPNDSYTWSNVVSIPEDKFDSSVTKVQCDQCDQQFRDNGSVTRGDKGSVTRGWLGVAIQRISPDLMKAFGLENTHGAIVTDVMSDGPAMQAGLQRGDVIVEFNGHKVQDSTELPRMIAAIAPGTKVQVDVLRNRKKLTIPVTLGAASVKYEAE